MYFISKLVIKLLNPFWWIIWLLLAAWVVKGRRWKQIFRIAAVVVFLVFSNSALYRNVLYAWQPEVKLQLPDSTYSAGILLGGMVFSNQKNETYFGGNADRFIQTTRLYHTGKIRKIVIAAGDGSLQQQRPKEGLFLRNELMAQDIPADDILTESGSRNTTENAREAKRLLDSAGLKPPYLLITSAHHMRRAVLNFQLQGLEVQPHPANYMVIDRQTDWRNYWVPDLGTLLAWPLLLKEMIGYAFLKIRN